MQEGAGHTMAIHTTNEAVIEEFALRKPVSRLLVNTSATLGGIGATTNLFPAMTLGSGAVGGSSTSDNIAPQNLFNIRRIAWGVRELSDIRGTDVFEETIEDTLEETTGTADLSKDQLINLLVERVLEKIK